MICCKWREKNLGYVAFLPFPHKHSLSFHTQSSGKQDEVLTADLSKHWSLTCKCIKLKEAQFQFFTWRSLLEANMLEVIPSEVYIKEKEQRLPFFGRQFNASLILC
jgi:hypothetical protein